MKGIKLTLSPNKLLHVGVSIKLNKKHFLAKKDYDKRQVLLENRNNLRWRECPY